MSDNNLRTAAAAVIAGVFTEYRLVKTRSAFQLIIELPIEHQAQAFEALGYPIPGTAINVAVARLNSSVGRSHQPQHERTTDGGHGPQPKPQPAGETHKRSWYELPASQRAALLCKDERFQFWASVSLPPADGRGPEENAKEYLRRRCGVKSRAELTMNDTARRKFEEIESDYRIRTGLEAAPR